MEKIKACGYVRMSTGKKTQEKSPEEQKREIEAYAKDRNYRVVKWYSDSAVSGDDTRKRTGFQKMIADAVSGNDFNHILVWDRDRFGRFDTVESGYWSYLLREADVKIDTVTQGVIDWTSFSGRIVDSVNAEAKYQFLVSQSENVSRGLTAKARRGGWAFGLVPFGYCVDGESRLIPDPETAPIVVSLFQKYLSGRTLRELSEWLESIGTKTRRGNKWSPSTLSDLLSNQHYLGRLTYGKTSMSKYRHGIRKGTRIDLPADQWVVVKDNHEPLIDQATFDAVAEKRSRNRRNTGPKKMNGEFALKGLLTCGSCGGPMDGYFNKQRGVHQYICRCYLASRGACDRYVVDESVLLGEILKALRTEVFDHIDQESIELIREQMKELNAQRETVVHVNQEHLRKIENKLTQAKRRLIEVEADMVRHVTERIRELEDEHAQVADQIAKNKVDAQSQVNLAEERIESAMSLLGRIEEFAGDPDIDRRAMREMIGQMVQSVRVNIRRVAIGSRKHRCELIGGVIHFRIAGMPADLCRLVFNSSSCSDFQTEQNNESFAIVFRVAA